MKRGALVVGLVLVAGVASASEPTVTPEERFEVLVRGLRIGAPLDSRGYSLRGYSVTHSPYTLGNVAERFARENVAKDAAAFAPPCPEVVK